MEGVRADAENATQISEHSTAFASETVTWGRCKNCRGDALTDRRPQSTVRLSSSMETVSTARNRHPDRNEVQTQEDNCHLLTDDAGMRSRCR